MRQIKDYLRVKKYGYKKIGIDIGGELKHYPISSLICDYSFSGLGIPYVCRLTIKPIENSLITLLTQNLINEKFNIYHNNNIFFRCFIAKYSIDNNIYTFDFCVDYFLIN